MGDGADGRRQGETYVCLMMIARPERTLFLAMFAGQAGFMVLSPILPEISREFAVTTATAGQLRLVSAAAGGATALAIAPLARRIDLRSLLMLGLGLLAVGSVACALAPLFSVLLAAQLAVGAGLGIVVSAALAAAAEWAAPEGRSRVVSWALLGQPAAWVAGMPVAGVVGEIDWRLAWIAVPFLASLLGIAAVRRRPSEARAAAPVGSWRRVMRSPEVAGWALGELLAFAAWGGTLVFSGALFIESYGASAAGTGVLLAIGAAAYFPGNLLVRRRLPAAARPVLAGFGLALAIGVAALGIVRPGIGFSAALFAGLVFLAGGRTLAGSATGLDAAPEQKMAVTSIRAAATQFGYLLGAGVAGVALAAGGYPALGLAQGAMFAAGALAPIAIPAASKLRGAGRGGVSPRLGRA